MSGHTLDYMATDLIVTKQPRHTQNINLPCCNKKVARRYFFFAPSCVASSFESLACVVSNAVLPDGM